MTNNHRLRVGVDFGTTHSAVAWASCYPINHRFWGVLIANDSQKTYTAKPEEIFTINQWPGSVRTFELGIMIGRLVEDKRI